MNSAGRPSIGFLIHDVARLLRVRFDQRARSLGLTRAQWHTLASVVHHNGSSQARIAEIMEVEQVTLGRALDKLEEAGWVERRPDPADRRINLVFMTERAQPIQEKMWEIADEIRAEAFVGLGQAETDRLVAALSLIRNNLTTRIRRPAAAAAEAEPSPTPPVAQTVN